MMVASIEVYHHTSFSTVSPNTYRQALRAYEEI